MGRAKKTGANGKGSQQAAASVTEEAQPSAEKTPGKQASAGKRAKLKAKASAKSARRSRAPRTRTKAATRPPRTAPSRRRFTQDERQRILATATRERLTGAQVADRFGISQVTYYLWKKNARPVLRQAVTTVRDSGFLDLAERVRQDLQARVQEMIPDVVRQEIDLIFSERPRRRRR